MTLNDMLKNLFLWLIIAVILISVFNNLEPRQAVEQRLTYSEFLHQVQQGNVSAVNIQNQVISGTMQNDKSFVTYMPMTDQYLLPEFD